MFWILFPFEQHSVGMASILFGRKQFIWSRREDGQKGNSILNIYCNFLKKMFHLNYILPLAWMLWHKNYSKEKTQSTQICYICVSYLHYQDYLNVIVIKINMLVIFFYESFACLKAWIWSCNQVLMANNYM